MSKLLKLTFFLFLALISRAHGNDLYLGRPGPASDLSAIPTEVIARAETLAWNREYNNFIDASDLCFDRAVDVIGELSLVGPPASLHEGSWDFRHSNVAKMFLVFPYRYQVRATDGSLIPSTRWTYHIASAVRGDDGEWHPIDPDRQGNSPPTPEAWARRFAWDVWNRPLTVTRAVVGSYYTDLPPAGQVYFYWLPADYYQPGYDAGIRSLITFFTRDPISGWSQSVAALRYYRAQMLARSPGVQLSSVDLAKWLLAIPQRLRLSAEVVKGMKMPGAPAAP